MRTTLKQTLAGAWMLLATLALATAGCSQLEDAPTPPVATGNEPISISIAPKPAFEAGDAATRNADAEAQTRSTVAPNGTFAWAAGDRVYVILTFDDLAATKKEQLWVKVTTATAGTPVAGWNVYTGWNANTATATALTDQTWPVGAKTCKVQAFHTNCGHTVASDGSGLTSFTYADGQGDYVVFTKDNFAVGDELAIAFTHATVRVTFTGLKPNTVYNLKVLNRDGNVQEVTLHAGWKKSFVSGGGINQSFTTNPDGTFTRCLPITSFINASTGAVELTIYDATGTTSISKGTLQAQGSTGSWVTNGYRYTMNVSNFTGDTNPGNRPDLLTPAPITPGVKVYELNGYFITQPTADSDQNYKWANADTATGMATDPCKGNGNWRMPTMKDFEVIAGWGTTNPYSESKIGTNNTTTISAASMTALSAKINTVLWSSERHTNASYAPHALSLYINGTTTACYSYTQKTSDAQIRCVQSVKPVTP